MRRPSSPVSPAELDIVSLFFVSFLTSYACGSAVLCHLAAKRPYIVTYDSIRKKWAHVRSTVHTYKLAQRARQQLYHITACIDTAFIHTASNERFQSFSNFSQPHPFYLSNPTNTRFKYCEEKSDMKDHTPVNWDREKIDHFEKGRNIHAPCCATHAKIVQTP